LNKKQTEQLREIAMKIGLVTVEAAQEFLPRVAEGIAKTDKAISFGIKVKVKHGKNGTLECEIRSQSPKIPTADLDASAIVLKLDTGGQLELLFDGNYREMEAAIAHDAAKVDDGYAPTGNARTPAEAESGSAARAETDGETVH